MAETNEQFGIMKKWINCGILMFYLNLHFAHAQSPAFYTINNENGAPTNEVYRVIQDKGGFIWIGCNSGLFRYNGSEFTSFTSSKQNSRAISFLLEDGKGRIWSKNFFGQIFRTDGNEQRLILDFNTSDPNFPHFTVDNPGNLYTNTGHTVCKHDENGKKVGSVEITGLGENEKIMSINCIDNLILGVTDQLRLFEINPKTLKITRELVHHSQEKIMSGVNSLIKHKGILYLFTEEVLAEKKYCLYTITQNRRLVKAASMKDLGVNERIHGIYSDESSIWAYGSNGAFKLSEPKDRLFEGNRISHMLKDNAGMVWFSSLDDGLLVMPDPEVTFLNAKNSVLTENYITCSHAVSSNEVLMGSYTGNLYNYNSEKGSVTPVYSSSEEAFIAVKKIGTFKNYILVSRGRFCIIDRRTGKQHFTNFSNVRDFSFKGDEIYLVFNQFIIKMPFESLFKQNASYTLLTKEGGKEIEHDPSVDKMVISTSKGTFWLDKSNKLEEIKRDGKSLFSTTIVYRDGILWIGTVSNGLLGFKKDQVVHHYSKGKGLSESVILALNASGRYVWISTDKYLYRLEPGNHKIERFGTNVCINASDVLHIELSNHEVYLSTNKAFFKFPSRLSLRNRGTSNFKISGVENNGKAIPLQGIIHLNYTNSNVKFYLSTLLIKNRGDYKIEYQLEGLNTTWEAVSSTSSYIFIPQIPPGEYQFRVRIIDPFGKTIELPKRKILVAYPIHQTWWFVLLCGISVLGLLYFIVRRRVRYIQRKEEAKNQLIQSQLTALKVQMNPHFMFNTLNSLQDLILKQDFKNTNYYLTKYASLMRLILENSERNEIGMDEEVEMLDTYLKLEKLRFGNEFNYQIICSDELIDQNYKIPPMIIQPYVENAIKHGLLHKSGSKELTVHFEEDGTNFRCTIEDNGIGRHESQRIHERQGKSHHSFSSKATDQRLNLMQNFHNKEFNVNIIDINENNRTGTKVIVFFTK